MEALTAYGTYRQGREWRTTPARLSVVPPERVPFRVELELEEAGTRRLLGALPTDQPASPRNLDTPTQVSDSTCETASPSASGGAGSGTRSNILSSGWSASNRACPCSARIPS